MAGRVIQGFFVGGRMHPMPGVKAAAALQRAAAPSRAPGPPRAAFAPSAQPVQRHGGDGNFEIDPIQLGLARSGGKPLPQPVLAKMEAAFGADFSGVRIHVGPQAARIGAIAFTTGNDVYFAPGRYQPDSIQGQQLLGHELAHVIQQRQGRVRTPAGGVAVVQDRLLEAEADRLGARAAMHRAAPVQAKMAGGGTGVHIAGPNGAGRGSQRITAGAGGAMGSLLVHTDRGSAAEVTDLSVGAHFRDRGIGRELLRSAARAGLRAGNTTLSLSAQDNGSGRLTRWYKDMGFQQVGVNGRGFPLLEASISRVLGNSVQRKANGAIQRAEPVEQKSASGKDYTNTFVAWLKEADKSANGCNYSVGRTTSGNYIVSKVGGVTSKTAIIKLFIEAFTGKIGDAKVYAAKSFSSGSPSGNHAEMCVVAANNLAAGKLEKVICTDPNCDLCAQQLSDMKITCGSITAGSPGKQQTWCHPTKKAYFGTQYGESDMATIAKALNAFNTDNSKPPKATCGAVVTTAPGGSLEHII